MNLPGLCQSCTARDFDCVNELDRIEMNSTREGVYECSRYKFKEATVSDYCGDCEHFPGEGEYCHYVYDSKPLHDRKVTTKLCPIFAASPACRKFEAKKRTCGECGNAFWQDTFSGEDGVCFREPNMNGSAICRLRHSKACDNFKGEA